jgi:hypothetical protein
MILAVGPGTPASFCWTWTREGGAEEPEGDVPWSDDDNVIEGYIITSDSDEQVVENDDDDSDDEDAEEEDDDDDGDDESTDEDSAPMELSDIPNDQSTLDSPIVHPLREGVSDQVEITRSGEETLPPVGEQQPESAPRFVGAAQDDGQESEPTRRAWRPSIRHGGCINTVAWLDSPWRLSTVHEGSGCVSSSLNANIAAVHSDEYPTQLISSGDDCLVKFWDLSHAMGSASPLAGGWDTLAPYAASVRDVTNLDQQEHRVAQQWQSYYRDAEQARIPGSVHHLATLHSGHRANVFHVTPLHAQPGSVLTCGADGYLRLSNLEQGQATSVVVQPREQDGEDPFLSSVAYSHHMLNAHVGLLCSERGLFRFDLRVNPREQVNNSLLSPTAGGWKSASCKACAVWTPPWMPRVSQLSNGTVDSIYAFCGGASSVVHLYDLRMDGGESRIVQKYLCSHMSPNAKVSVSGLDISKNGQEVLVSFEGDQIYTFPVYPHTKSAAGPTPEELAAAPQSLTPPMPADYLTELASYGGHLNRRTFLKSAVYAGPNDEYICTGSDSGHAWIFERSSGTAVSFLGADSRTCNGIVPHPSAPVFVSYGIDSSAKVWRATAPVDETVNDSSLGRAKIAQDELWECSPITSNWTRVQQHFRPFDMVMKGLPSVTPDIVPGPEEMKSEGPLSRIVKGLDGSPDSPVFGNALRNLASVLRHNQFLCLRGQVENFDNPIWTRTPTFCHRSSLSRLRYQAERLGLLWDPRIPYVFRSSDEKFGPKIHPADLVPDFPGDWVGLDPRVLPRCTMVGCTFNAELHGADLLAER